MPNDYEAHSPIPSPSEVTNRFANEVLNNRNLAVIDEIAAEDYVELDLPPGQAPGREGVCVMFVRRASALAMCVTLLGGFLAFFLLPADPALAQDPATTC